MKTKNLIRENFLISALISANLIGTLFGIYYYIPQLLSTETFLWPLIPDSPTATFLFMLSLIAVYTTDFKKGKGLKNILYTLAFIGNIKYGLWTVYVLIEFMPYFTSINSGLMYLFLIFSHIGMFLQAFLILPYVSYSKSILIAPLAYLLNDIIDYSLQIHTSLPEAQQIDSKVAVIAYSLTLASGLLFYLKKHVNISGLKILENY